MAASKYIASVLAVVVSIIIVGSVLAPTIDDISGGSWDETITTVYNEDPNLQFDKQISDYVLDMSVTIGDNLIITNGDDEITVPYGSMFLLAADNFAIFINANDEIKLTWTIDRIPQSVDLNGDFTAVISDDKIIIDDGTSYEVPLPNSYLYVPSSAGGYGSFTTGDLNKRAEDPIIAAGSFAGVVGYNTSITLVSDDMDMSADATDTLITSVSWIKAPVAEPAITPFDGSSITIHPLDPSILDPTPDASITSVPPTPSFTDGDWGYEKISSGTAAQIVSYSGAGGGTITIPSTVGGLPVKEIGKGTVSIFNTDTITATQLVIPSGVTKIISYAFKDCIGITGELVIPDTVTVIGKQAFQNTGFTGTLTIPSSVITLQESAFRQCSGFTNIVFPENITSIPNYTFYQCRGLDTVLTIPDNITNIGNYAFGSIGSSIVILPSSLTNIGTQAFNSTNIKSMVSYLDSDVTIGSNGLGFSSLKEILNLGTLELTTTSYGLSLDAVQDFIDAEAYIAPATLTETIHHSGGSGSYSALYSAILVTTILAVLVAAALLIGVKQY